MSLRIIEDKGLERTYKLSDGRVIKIVIDDLFESISVKNTEDKEVGRIEFREILDEYRTCYKITWMYMDLIDRSYKKKGIGREALRFFKETIKAPIIVSEDDGMRKNNGSHLTGDAPAFVSKMQDEGIIEKPYYHSLDDEN